MKSLIGSSLGANVFAHSTGSHNRKSIPISDAPVPEGLGNAPKVIVKELPARRVPLGSLSPGDRFETVEWPEVKLEDGRILPGKPAKRGRVVARGYEDTSADDRGIQAGGIAVTRRNPRLMAPVVLVRWEHRSDHSSLSPSLVVVTR